MQNAVILSVAKDLEENRISEILRQVQNLALSYQSKSVPSSLRLIGKYARW
jgi:hypothetical protein